jgi:hypothetical protein
MALERRSLIAALRCVSRGEKLYPVTFWARDMLFRVRDRGNARPRRPTHSFSLSSSIFLVT